MSTEKASYEAAMLGGPNEPAIDPNGFYYIDFNKITRAEDLVSILAAVNFSFVGNHPRIHIIAHLLDRENVQYPKDNLPQPITDADEDTISVDGYATSENEDGDSGL